MNVKNQSPQNIAAYINQINQLQEKLDDYYISTLDKNEEFNNLYTKYNQSIISYNTEISTLKSELQSNQTNAEHLAKKVITLNNDKEKFITSINENSSYICPFNKINNSTLMPCGKCTTCKLNAAYSIITANNTLIKELNNNIKSLDISISQKNQDIKHKDIIINQQSILLSSEKSEKNAVILKFSQYNNNRLYTKIKNTQIYKFFASFF